MKFHDTLIFDFKNWQINILNNPEWKKEILLNCVVKNVFGEGKKCDYIYLKIFRTIIWC